MKKQAILFALLALIFKIALAQNPYASIGKTANMLTLSEGVYQEYIPNDTLINFDGAIFNRVTNQLVRFLTSEEQEKLKVLSTSSRFLSIDPIGRKFPELSPYQFASNTPIQAIDLDGLEGVRITKGVTLIGIFEAHYEEKIDGTWTTKPIKGRTFGLYRTYLTAPNRFNLNTVLGIRSDSDVDNDASQTSTGGTQQGSTSYTYKGMYINPDEVNFFAFPSKDKGIGSALDKEGLELGDLGMALTSNGNGGYNAVIGIYADHGPNKMTGEQSSKGNSGLGFGADPERGGSTTNNVYYLAFPKTAKFWQGIPETFRNDKGSMKTRSLQERIQLGFSKMYKNLQLDQNIVDIFAKMMNENAYKNFDNKPEVEKNKKTKN